MTKKHPQCLPDRNVEFMVRRKQKGDFFNFHLFKQPLWETVEAIFILHDLKRKV